MLIIGIASRADRENLAQAGYKLATANDAQTYVDIMRNPRREFLDEGEEWVAVYVDCDPAEALWPTLCPCGGLREPADDLVYLRPGPGFVRMRCERCGSTVLYSEAPGETGA